jgi:hypothetical protein
MKMRRLVEALPRNNEKGDQRTLELTQAIPMESVYLETTFISYLVARPSRDVIVAGQQTTQDWWANRRSQFECSVSQVVIDEASLGDPAEVQKRLAVINDLPTLEVTEDAKALTKAIMAAGMLPPHAFPDAAHVAVSAVHAIDYLLTWNCKHLANAQIARRIAVVCEKLGHRMSIICTPEELMGE